VQFGGHSDFDAQVFGIGGNDTQLDTSNYLLPESGA
jgi:hypothetical protein